MSDENNYCDKMSITSSTATNYYQIDGQYYGSDQSLIGSDFTIEDNGTIFTCLT